MSHPSTQILYPTFDRSQLKTRIVHLGIGAFYRAHQALYTSEVLDKLGGDWGICGVNLRSGETIVADLHKQNHQFIVLEKGADANTLKRVDSMIASIYAKQAGIAAVLAKMSEQQVAIVSITITEKGYCLDPASGKLDVNHPAIVKDLANPNAPETAIGCIVEALRLRRELGYPPFTVMSCDNLQGNGHVARAAVLGFAHLCDRDLADWIEASVTFPSTMIDRIVPAVTTESLAEISQLLGYVDPCAIACEPFRQWVIEDNFVAGRPDWDCIDGVTFVDDVLPFEQMKLRMLNGSHSFLAYLGYLAGYPHISDTMQDAHYRQAAFDLMLNEQAPTLSMPEGTDLEAYAKLLIARYSNPSLQHKTWQIAMDGSQKLPQRMVDSLHYHLAKGSDYSHLALGVAGWMRYISAQDEQGAAIDVRDPMVEKFNAIYAEHGLNVSVVRALLSIEAIFGKVLVENHAFVQTIEQAYQQLLQKGAKQAVAELAQRVSSPDKESK